MGDIDPVSVWRSWFNPTHLARPTSAPVRGVPNRSRAPGPTRQATSHAVGHGSASWYDHVQDRFSVERITHYFDCLTIRESNWKFETSAGADLSIGTPTVHVGVNLTGGALWLKDGDDGKPIECRYGGIGGSLSLYAIPFLGNISFSLPQMPSYGMVYQLPCAGTTLSLKELTGTFVLFVGSADAGVGWSGSVMFIGGSPMVAGMVGATTANLGYVAALLATSKACVRFHGMGVTLLPYNIGVNAYVGAIGVAT
jgi:hypothetical protein